MAMPDSAKSAKRLPRWLKRRLANGAMNLIWLAVTAAMLVLVHYLWPYHHWTWGLVLGAGVGGSAVFATVLLAKHTPLPRLLGVDRDAA